MRRSSIALIACFGLAGIGVSGSAVRGQESALKGGDPSVQSDAERDTQRLLDDKMIESTAFNGDSLETALNFVRDATGANMVVLWGSIESVGIKRDRSVTHSLKHVTAAQLLNVILDGVSTEQEGENRLSYAIDGNIIKIAPCKELKLATVEKSYDIRELLMEVPDFTDAPTLGLSGGNGLAGPDIFKTDAAAPENPSRAMIEELISRIKEHVGTKPEWDDNLSVITPYDGRLLVKTTPKNHRELASLMKEFREQKFLPIVVQARVLRMSADEFEKLSEQTGGTLELDAAGVQKLMARAADRDSGLQVLAFGCYRCMKGQRTYVVGGEQKKFVEVANPEPIGRKVTETKKTTENKEGKVLDESKTTEEPRDIKDAGMARPVIGMAQQGLVVDVEPVVSADHRQVTATIRSSWAALTDLRRLPAVNGIQQEIPTMDVLQWRGTAVIPSGGAVLLVSSAVPKEGQNAMATVLVLQATVVEMKGK